MMSVYGVLKKNLLTEKTMEMKERSNKVVFSVERSASKHLIKHAVEVLFGVKVSEVKTMAMHGKRKRVGKSFGRQSDWKKAVVTIRDGEKMDAFDVV